MSKVIDLPSLEESLKAKGAIRNGKPIPHKEVLEKFGVFPCEGLIGLEHEYLRYLRYRYEIAEVYDKAESWEAVYETVYTDANENNEAFIDYVEEVYSTKVKDVKHLQELLGVYYCEYSERGRVITLEEAQEYGTKCFTNTIKRARLSKYSRALDLALANGAKYKDLLQIKPKDYGLPETWANFAGRLGNQYNCILFAIHTKYELGRWVMDRPDFSTIAESLEAPLSVIVEAFKLWSGGEI